MKKALITGITGQDGSYLAELLISKNYEVHGIVRRSSVSNTERIDHLIAENAVTLHDGDLSDSSSIIRIVNEVRPDEIYNLAAQSHVQVSFDAAEYTGDVDALGVLRILEQYICSAWINPAEFIRHLLLNFSAKWKSVHKAKQHHFTHTAHMQLQSSMAIG